jgi:hypothetical protein
MAKASQEPEKAAEPKPSVGTWPKSEHVLHAEALHGQPAWLVEYVLRDRSDDEALSKEEVADQIKKFLNHKMEVEG